MIAIHHGGSIQHTAHQFYMELIFVPLLNTTIDISRFEY
ncbi:hypothetical protein yberc0001_33190 [Yersinia bercovieri ATCC 43970]|uniref:Uncharacterized protein n=1 Tax=Yersinia bercovieri ATCC 43970 TaxID=349968 RepID=A0ABM9Y223_YERBE|nr:hypothetical protein yberc0001_33190 [Yersinia bercovieri ATCC 43970]